MNFLHVVGSIFVFFGLHRDIFGVLISPEKDVLVETEQFLGTRKWSRIAEKLRIKLTVRVL